MQQYAGRLHREHAGKTEVRCYYGAVSWALATKYGAVGPVIGSALGVLCFQVIANLIFVQARTRRAVAAES